MSEFLDSLSTDNLAWIVAIAASFAGAVIDTARRRLPNRLTLPVWLCGLAFAFGAGGGVGLLAALAGSLICAAPFVILFVFARGGAGDAKMMGAVGAWVGLAHAPAVVVCVVVAGAGLAFVYAFVRREGWSVLNCFAVTAARLGAAAAGGASYSSVREALPAPSGLGRFPYGAAIFAGVTAAAIGVQLWNV